jgi:hypothetical protein
MYITYFLNQIEALLIVHEGVSCVQRDPFFLVLFLFQLENVHVEKLLQLLITISDTELLEAVVLHKRTFRTL